MPLPIRVLSCRFEKWGVPVPGPRRGFAKMLNLIFNRAPVEKWPSPAASTSWAAAFH
jgi:hypothetical protein